SVAVTSPTTFGIIAWQLLSTASVLSTGQCVIAGALDSKTLKGTMQVVLLFALSVTVTVMGFGPTPTSVPAAGLCVIISEVVGVQLPAATISGMTFGPVPGQPAPAGTDLPVGQVVIVGATMSAIVTTVEQVLELPAPSITVTVTVCGPVSTIVPAG